LVRVARPHLLGRFRRTDEQRIPGPVKAEPPRRPLPHPGILRRERRALLKVREDRLRDLGGLMLEMFRRDQFRQDLLVDRCEDLMALDDRLHQLETLLAASVSVRRAAPPARCSCGAPLVWGSHFCANCGRPAAAMPAVVACAKCGSALAADAKFCGVCGTAVPAESGSEPLGALPATGREPSET
jgi:hypothetical protein